MVTRVSGQVPSGIPGLDGLMSGGAKQGDATLVTGPSGVGKTIFGLRWLTQGADLGQHCLYVTFQDTADQLVGVAAAFGWDLTSAGASESVSISYVPMGNLDLDVLATAVRSELRAHATGRIVIDSLSELAFAAREEQRFPAYMRSLVGLVRRRAVHCWSRAKPAPTGFPPTRWTGSCSCSTTSSTCGTSKTIRVGGRARRQDAQHPARADAEQRQHHRPRPRGRERTRRRDRAPRLERATKDGPLQSSRPVAKSPAGLS